MDYQENNRGVGTTGATGAAGAVKEEVQRLAGDAKEGTAQVAERAKETVSQTATTSKEQAAERIGNLASSFRDAGQMMDSGDAALVGRYAGLAADELEKVASWLRGRDLKEIVRDTETFARRHPDLFMGGAFVAGLAIARFLKSSAPDETGLEPMPASASAPMGMPMPESVYAPSPEPMRNTGAGFGYGTPGTTGFTTPTTPGTFAPMPPSTFTPGERSTFTPPVTTPDPEDEGGL